MTTADRTRRQATANHAPDRTIPASPDRRAQMSTDLQTDKCPACDQYHLSHPTKRVLVTGSRDWDDEATMSSALGLALGEIGPYILVHGDARGADRMAERIVTPYGLHSERHPAEWERLGKRAGYVRNAEMVDLGADLCLAFIKDNSKGATMCADLAEKAGIPTRRYTA